MDEMIFTSNYKELQDKLAKLEALLLSVEDLMKEINAFEIKLTFDGR